MSDTSPDSATTKPPNNPASQGDTNGSRALLGGCALFFLLGIGAVVVLAIGVFWTTQQPGLSAKITVTDIKHVSPGIGSHVHYEIENTGLRDIRYYKFTLLFRTPNGLASDWTNGSELARGETHTGYFTVHLRGQDVIDWEVEELELRPPRGFIP